MLKKIFKKNKSIINKFHLIFKSKHENLDLNIKDYSIWIKKFVKIFENHLFKEEKKYRKIFFIRHCKTLLNDNTFLGVRRDPYIKIDHNITKKINNFKKENIKVIYSSKLQRAIQTAKLFGLKNITTNTLLNEKDYGDAEGFDYLKLSRKFPHITEAWNKQKDLKFPNGENDKSVLMRVKKFKKILLKFLQKKKINGNIAIITHNVVLRCLIGDEFKIPKSLWYKISIEHLAKIEFIYYKGQMLPNINREQLLGDLLK